MKAMSLTDEFRREWCLYRQDYPASGRVYKMTEVVHEGNRVPVSVLRKGQIRLISGVEPPLLVYILSCKQTGTSCEIIPVSPFRCPATSGEALIGKRTYQFWNLQSLPKAILAQSFKVETVAADEQIEISQVADYLEKNAELPEYLKPALGLPIRSESDDRLQYLADFSVEQDLFEGTTSKLTFTHLSARIMKVAFAGCETAMAAANLENDHTSAVIADHFPRSAKDFKRQYVECELKSQFLSLLPGEHGERPLVYTWEGDVPDGMQSAAVAAYVSKTGELFGKGVMDVKTHRIVINDFTATDGVSVSLCKASELSLVLVPCHAE